MADDRIRILEERLTRLESVLAQRPGSTGGAGGFTPPSGVIVDSAPWANQFQRASPTDPVPWIYWGGWRPRWPTPVVDPRSQ